MNIIKKLESTDGYTTKFLQETKDGHVIETGYYNLDENTFCISSQIGCLMRCVFCATTLPSELSNKPFIRNLTKKEIIQEVENIIKILPSKRLKSKQILFSFMGMGEPLLNYDNVVGSIKFLSKKYPYSRTTISTIGNRPNLMKKLAKEKIDTTLKLHLSLHASNNKIRKTILPSTEQLKPALEALEYFSRTRNIKSKVNYVLIKGLNDSKKDALELARILKPYSFTVKLSNLNDINGLKTSPIDKFRVFEKVLNEKNIETCRFFSIGTDIKAGCGQLRRDFINH